MSVPSLENILTEHSSSPWSGGAICYCGGEFDSYAEWGAHVASLIREHSMTLYRVASTLGPQYMVPTLFETLADAELFMRNHDRLAGDLPGADTLRIEYQIATDWAPLSDRAEGQS